MSIRMRGRRVAATITTVVGAVSIAVTGIASLVVWQQTEQAKSASASAQQPGDGGGFSSEHHGDGGFGGGTFGGGGQVGTGQGGVQSQSSGS